jgi:phosphoribosylaminoimidazole-succinocarboxamide synthase
MTSGTVYRTALSGMKLLHAGKVRDNYAVDEQNMLIVTTDRMSAFDVILPDPIPQKGQVLTQISNFWFDRTRHIVPNHLTGRSLAQLPLPAAELATLEGRAVIVKRLKPLPVDAVVRGYLQHLRHRTAGGSGAGRPAAHCDLHARDQGRRGSA